MSSLASEIPPKNRGARQQELFRHLDQVSDDIRSNESPLPSIGYVLAMEGEL